jgi:N-acylglucosamine 2-epimerase
MIFSFFFHNLGQALGRADIRQAGYQHAQEVLRDFYVPERSAVLEYVSLEGEPATQHPKGRVCIPGHVIEAAWFLISIFETTGDRELIRRCCDLIKRHLELGWDREYGGIRLALDIEGQEPVAWQKADCKPWWVHTEALVATAYARVHTGEAWCLDWHRRIHEYAYSHYPVPTGEWTQWLDRRGNKAGTAALPVKDPFHLPRSLIYLIELLEQRSP